MSMQKFRFSDREDFIKGSSDFILRRRAQAQQVYTLFSMVIVAIMSVTSIIYNQAFLASGICLITGIAMYYVAYQYEKLIQQLQASEFMNAMFASALRMHYKFCMVVRPDGEIVYLDRGFQAMFPDFSPNHKRTLDTLFELCQVDVANRQKVISAVSRRVNETMNFFVVAGQERTTQAIELIIEAIPHPRGFVLVRGSAA